MMRFIRFLFISVFVVVIAVAGYKIGFELIFNSLTSDKDVGLGSGLQGLGYFFLSSIYTLLVIPIIIFLGYFPLKTIIIHTPIGKLITEKGLLLDYVIATVSVILVMLVVLSL